MNASPGYENDDCMPPMVISCRLAYRVDHFVHGWLLPNEVFAVLEYPLRSKQPLTGSNRTRRHFSEQTRYGLSSVSVGEGTSIAQHSVRWRPKRRVAVKLVKCLITVLAFCLTVIMSAPVAARDSSSPSKSEASTNEGASRFDANFVVTRGDQSQRSSQITPGASAVMVLPSGAARSQSSNEKILDMDPIIAAFVGLSLLLVVVVAFAARSQGKRSEV